MPDSRERRELNFDILAKDSPYLDWDDLGITEGSLISFKTLTGELITETVTKVDRNKATGEISMTLGVADA